MKNWFIRNSLRCAAFKPRIKSSLSYLDMSALDFKCLEKRVSFLCRSLRKTQS